MQASRAESDQQERLRRGDQTAFKELFDAHYDALCRFACQYVHSLEVAEDLVQDVFSDLWVRRASWQPQRSSKAYLYGAIRNQTLNHQRRERVRSRGESNPRVRGVPALDNVPSDENPEQTLRGQELAGAAQQAIMELPRQRRFIFVLSREHELTYAEIALVLGVSVKTVETQMGRALKHLRERLAYRRSSLHS